MSPRFSFVTPVYNTPAGVLTECIESVLAQTNEDWELCLVNDGSTAPHIGEFLDSAAASDARIRVHHRFVNGGIVAASNDALDLASGDFIVLLDHDDTIEAETLQLIDNAISADERVDLVYSDADKLDTDGNRMHPFIKPDWSPERFRHQNYLIHIAAARRSIVSDVGGFRQGFDGSQDYDLLLRISERSRVVHHIPKVLYHWRMIPGSAAGDPQAKPAAYGAGQRAISDHCEREGIKAAVSPLLDHPGSYSVRRVRSHSPLVSVVMPTEGAERRLWGINQCLATNAVRRIREVSTYDRVEWVPVLAHDCEPSVRNELRLLCGGSLTEVVQPAESSLSEAWNRGVSASSGEIVVLLSDDVEVLTPDWLEQFIAALEDKTVGSVGGLLLEPNFRVRSAGRWHGRVPQHLGRGLSRSDSGPFSALHVARECSSLSGALMAARRETWEQVGGMAVTLAEGFNDADFGNKLTSLALRNLWMPSVEAVQHEPSVSAHDVPADQLDGLNRRWRRSYRCDSYFPAGVW